MKIYISVDVDGIGSLAEGTLMSGYPPLTWVQELVTREVNAAVEGALEGGATHVVVNENHSSRHILPELLHPEAVFMAGRPKPMMTLDGLDASFDAVFLVGIHARAGTAGAVMDHTWSKEIYNLRVNDVTIGEVGLNALLAGHYGVPIALVSGDDKVAKEARDLLGAVETVVVKTGRDRYAARCLSPSQVRTCLKEGAARSLRELNRFRPFELGKPVRMEIDFSETIFAHWASYVPTAERVGPRTVGITLENFEAAMQAFLVLLAASTMGVPISYSNTS
jgi:D-amino peptidase